MPNTSASGITAFVPARSGSKRLPNKNIKPLAGKPLVLWTLEACARADAVSEIIFSTDSEEYWLLAQSYFADNGLKVPLVWDRRDPNDAGDNVKIFDYLNTRVDQVFGDRSGDFMLTLPTVPLRTAAHIDEAATVRAERGQPVFSAVEYSFPITFAFTTGREGEWEPVSDHSPMLTGNTRSQDQVKTYHPNGAIYIRSLTDLRGGSLRTLYDDAHPYIMSAEASVDIDAASDFMTAEGLVQAQKSA